MHRRSAHKRSGMLLLWCGVYKLIEGVESSFHLGFVGKVVKNWHDDTMHDEFLQSCHKQNELVYGVSCTEES